VPVGFSNAGGQPVHRIHPFTIRLKDRVGDVVQPVWGKRAPGSKTTGIAVTREEGGNKSAQAPCLFELTHRGAPTGMATPCRLRWFATVSRSHSFPA
jgi:hypothetical protein